MQLHCLLKWLALILPLAICTLVTGQDEVDPERKAKIEFMQKTAYEELRELFRTQANLKIEDIERFAGMELGELKKARVLAKKQIDALARQYGGITISRVGQFFNNRRIRVPEVDASFAFNEKVFTFEGEQEAVPTIRILLDPSRKMLQLWVELDSGQSSTSRFGGDDIPLNLETDPNWSKSLSALGEQKIDEYKANVQKRSNRRLRTAIMAIIDEELRLNPEQSGPMSAHLESTASFEQQFTLTENLVRNLASNKVFKTTPEFLTELQQAKWKTLRSNNPARSR